MHPSVKTAKTVVMKIPEDCVPEGLLLYYIFVCIYTKIIEFDKVCVCFRIDQPPHGLD